MIIAINATPPITIPTIAPVESLEDFDVDDVGLIGSCLISIVLPESVPNISFISSLESSLSVLTVISFALLSLDIVNVCILLSTVSSKIITAVSVCGSNTIPSIFCVNSPSCLIENSESNPITIDEQSSKSSVIPLSPDPNLIVDSDVAVNDVADVNLSFPY